MTNKDMSVLLVKNTYGKKQWLGYFFVICSTKQSDL